MKTTASKRVGLEGPITEGQRRALFAAAGRIGLDLDGLRAMTPAGSVSKLTRAEAASLLNRLNAGTSHDYPRTAELFGSIGSGPARSPP